MFIHGSRIFHFYNFYPKENIFESSFDEIKLDRVYSMKKKCSTAHLKTWSSVANLIIPPF